MDRRRPHPRACRHREPLARASQARRAGSLALLQCRTRLDRRRLGRVFRHGGRALPAGWCATYRRLRRPHHARVGEGGLGVESRVDTVDQGRARREPRHVERHLSRRQELRCAAESVPRAHGPGRSRRRSTAGPSCIAKSWRPLAIGETSAASRRSSFGLRHKGPEPIVVDRRRAAVLVAAALEDGVPYDIGRGASVLERDFVGRFGLDQPARGAIGVQRNRLLDRLSGRRRSYDRLKAPRVRRALAAASGSVFRDPPPRLRPGSFMFGLGPAGGRW